MGSGAWMMAVATALSLGALAVLIVSISVRSIANERSGERSLWGESSVLVSV